MKQQVREYFENMRRVLQQDEHTVLDFLELDLKRTKTRLDQVLKNWLNHQEQVSKSISSLQEAVSRSPTTEERETV